MEKDLLKIVEQFIQYFEDVDKNKYEEKEDKR